MNFSEILNNYINEIGCSAKELSDISGISNTVISRYRKGSRIPKYKSEQLERLIKALARLAHEKNINNINETEIRKSLEATIEKNEIDFEIFRNNFNIIIETLNINVADMARYIGYDSSYLSKIKTGSRKPSGINDFTKSICKYIINNYQNDNLKKLINYNNENTLYNQLYFWLTNNKFDNTDYNIDTFLKKLDEFDLNNYIKAIKFDKIKVPTLPKGISKTKIYYGLEGFKKAQIDTLKTIALSKAKDDVFFYSNMEMTAASKDLEFTKRFMVGLAFILKKGINLNVVHDLERPFKELMFGLEGWIPLYMTGQIRPYYFKRNFNEIYSQIDCISGSVALSGSCITGNIDTAKIIVTNKKDDLNYYKESSKLLLKKAFSLMNIYKKENKQNFFDLLNSNTNIKGDRRNILVNLPIYTLPNNLLNQILDKNNISDKEKEYIIKQINLEKKQITTILKDNNIIDEITIISRKEFDKEKQLLNLSRYFYSESEIIYSYDDYKKHIKSIKDFKKNNINYDFKFNEDNIFKNININIINDKQVIISKTNSPIIHFVISYPKLIAAIQNFNIPIREKDYNM